MRANALSSISGAFGVFENDQPFMSAPTMKKMARTPLSGKKKKRRREAWSMFGFGQADPLAAVNAPLVDLAKRKLSEFKQMRDLIPRLPTSGQRDQAMAIVNKKWYPPFNILNPFRAGKYNLDELAVQMAAHVVEPMQQFVRFSGKGLEVTRSREERLAAFRKGVNELRDFMKPFIIPMGVRIETVERTSEALIAKAQEAAARARSTKNPQDVAVALALAESARNTADDEGKSEIRQQAINLVSEMETMAKTLGVAAGTTQEEKKAEFPFVPVAIAVAVVAGITIYALTRKK